MVQSLRTKLALSHTLPILVLMPLLSLYLLYTLDDFFTQNLLQQLTNQARLLSEQIERDQSFVLDGAAAQTFVREIAPFTAAKVLILSGDGTILASTRADDAHRIGIRLDDPAVAQALAGNPTQGIGPGLVSEVAYVVLPLPYRGDRANAPQGALRLSYDVTDVRAQFSQLQSLVMAGVVFTTLLGLVLGVGLATSITRPLRMLSDSANQIAGGNLHARVAVRGRGEIGALAYNFNDMAERLEEAERARMQQLAAITHELARPLTGMRAAIETLREGGDDDPETRRLLLDGVGEEVGRLQRLIETLQGLQKRALRPMALHRSEVSLERVIRGSVAHYESLASRRNVQLSCEVAQNLPPVNADEDRLIQVMTNLLDNAFKFTPSGGSIRISAHATNGRVQVSVADSGEGIAPDELPHLFQQFYYGAPSRPPEQHGMGLGLAICQEIIRAHAGRIWVDSEPGRGACFTFWIPQ